MAVKIMKHAQSDDPKQDFFMSEVTAVSKLRHPNITVFYGVTEPPEPLIITELLDCSLHELLQNSSSHRTLPEVVMMRLLQDVAAGVNYLHSRRPSVIHRDVSTSNVLCSMPASASMDALVAAATDTSRPLAKLTDFGLSRNVDRYMTSCVGNLYYLAPEVFRGENYTESADVYSYGILVWEVLTRETPFANMNPQSVAFQAAVQGLRPPMPKDITPQLASLMEQCWHAEPLQRPPFTSIVLELSTVSQLDDAVEALAQAMEGSMMAQKTQPAVYAEFTAVASGELLKWSEISARLREFIANRVSAADLIRRNILRVSPADRTYLGLK